MASIREGAWPKKPYECLWWVLSGRARDRYASEISDRKHRSGIDRYMKTRSKHSLLTETALDF